MGGNIVDTALGHPRELFGSAALHLIVAVKQKRWRFLFGYVELLPREIPPPPHDKVVTGPVFPRSGYRVFADHVPLTVERGLEWYEDARSGRIVRPAVQGTVPRADAADAVLCEPHEWDEEPAWPGFIAAASTRALPFLSRWHATPRTHHLIARSFDLPFNTEELAVLDTFFDVEVGFRRSEFAQLVGGAHLVVPNPYYRALYETLDSGSSTHSAIESVVARVEPRRGVTLPPMTISIVEHRPVGLGRAVDASLTSTPVSLEIGPAIRGTSATVRLERDGSILEKRESTPFLRSVHTIFGLAGPRRSVSVKDATGAVLETYEVQIRLPHATDSGFRPLSAAADSLDGMLNELAVRRSATDLEQRWFAGDDRVARAFVRELFQRARAQVLVADPYFSAIEVQRFALATTVAGIPVRMLTTRSGFQPPTRNAPPSTSPAALAQNLALWQSTEPTLGRLELRVLERDELHDRFLRIDDRVYSLGNSLNSIGERASLLIRVPDPTPVIGELEAMWDAATPLEVFLRSIGNGGAL